MNIYTQNYPYVYRLDNLQTKEFYIGSRVANKVPSKQDLGYEYFTSSKIVTPRFNEFQVTIIAEFFDGDDAYNHEQYLIYCDWGNPLLLNKNCYYQKGKFNNIGTIFSDISKEKQKLTNLERYGFDNPSKSNVIKEKKKQTCLKNSGFEYSFQNPITQEKCRNTNLEKYGVNNLFESLIIQKQIKLTNLGKYGFEYPMQNPEIQEKAKQTLLEKSGFSNPMQNPEVIEKNAIIRRKKLLKKFECETEPEIIKKIFYFEKLHNIKRTKSTPNLTEILKHFPLTAHKSIKVFRAIFNNHYLISS